jgi:pimeloyl-ACP methyl ester carboxylesterase
MNTTAKVFVALLTLELAFYTYIRFLLHPKLCKVNYRPPPLTDPIEAIRRTCAAVLFLHARGVYTIEKYFLGWAIGSKTLSDIKKDNVLSFLSFALFGEELDTVKKDAPQHKVLQKSYEVLQEHFPNETRQIKDGFNPELSHPRMNLTEVFPIIHKPLIFYSIIKLLNLITHWIVLPYAGFKMHTFDASSITDNSSSLRNEVGNDESTASTAVATPAHTFTYWLREVPDNTESPFVILHGITHGWFCYLSSIYAMCPSRSVLLVDLPEIKMGHVPSLMPMPDPKYFAKYMRTLLNKHAMDKITLLGHSFGTFTCSWFMKQYPDYVQHLILVDPCSILLSLSDVAVNFLYRRPKTFMEYLINVFASRDIQVAKTLWRSFSWNDNILWLQNLPINCSCTIVLAEKDDILHASAIKAYSEDFVQQEVPKGVRRDLLFFPDTSHGDVLSRTSCLEEICASFKKTQDVMKLANRDDTVNPVISLSEIKVNSGSSK